MPRSFFSTPNNQNFTSQFSHAPTSALSSAESGPTFNISSPTIFAAPPDPTTAWEALRLEHNPAEFAVAGPEDAWLGVYRALEGSPPAREANRDLRIVTYLGRNPNGSPGFVGQAKALKPLHGLAHVQVIPAGRTLDDLQSRLQEGADALVILAHGDQGSGIRIGSDAEGVITAPDLLEPLRASAALGRPLRFLLVFACEQSAAFLEVLNTLALEGLLHADFAGVLFWERPRALFGEYFIPRLLRELCRPNVPKPFLEAVRLARRTYLVVGGNNQADAASPIAVAFHPQPNPLPTADELELERYWWRLSQLPETGFHT